MKKFFLFTLISCFALSLLSGCGGDEGSASDDSASGSTEETYTITFGIVDSEEQSTFRAAEKFKEQIEADTDGHVIVELYPNGTLGADLQLTEAVSQGTVQMSCVTSMSMSMYDTSWGIWDIPYIFDSAESFFAAADGDLGQQLSETLTAQNILCLGYGYNGARSVSNNLHPINSLEDLAGINIRVMESPVYIDSFKALGANPTPMAYSELFTGLQQGTVDGQDNSPSYIYKAKFYEVQDYYSLTEHVQSCFVTIMNLDFFNSLPEEYQTVVTDAARTWMVDYQREDQIEDDDTSLQELENVGLEINTVSPETKQTFMDALAPVYEQYESEIGAEIFELARSYNG